jgi:hypothetical protein
LATASHFSEIRLQLRPKAATTPVNLNVLKVITSKYQVLCTFSAVPTNGALAPPLNADWLLSITQGQMTSAATPHPGRRCHQKVPGVLKKYPSVIKKFQV